MCEKIMVYMTHFKLSKIITLVIVLLCLIGCNKEHELGHNGTENGTVNFALSPIFEITEQPAIRSQATEPKPIKSLWHAIFDSQDKVIQIRTQILKPDLSNLCIEGLANGRYSIVFMATTGDVKLDAIETLEDITQQWLTNESDDAPIDEDYLYKRISFEVDHNQPPQTIPVELQRISGRVELDLKPNNPHSIKFIRRVEISYNDNSFVNNEMSGEGICSGEMVIKNYDITKSLGFYSLPGIGKLSGVIRITATTTDNQELVSTYSFNNCEINSGAISKIVIGYAHPEDNLGAFSVSLKDYTANNSLTMFSDDEPRSTFYNASLRSFYVDQPLQVSINKNKELLVKFYSAIGIKNTKIMVRFKKYSSEFFELAHYDEIPPYHESRMAIPIVSKSRVFTSKDGRNIVIPAQPNLSEESCELKVVTDDPYMKKIATITCHWSITFSGFSATEPPTTNWRHMTPALCREGVALASNMAFMFASTEFYNEMNRKGSDGSFFYKLKDNSSVAIPHDVVMNKVKNHSGLNMGAVGGVNGLGGGTAYGLVPSRYWDNYWDATPPESFHKTTAYHELGHCIGYGHSSTMTYGNQWTVLCSRVMFDLGKAAKLPVSSKWVLNTSGNTEIPDLSEDND